MSEIAYTTVNSVLSKINRNLKGTDLNETDLIEWIGEASEFMKVYGSQEEAVAFLEVKDYHAVIPNGFQMVLQIAKNNTWQPEDDKCKPKQIIEEVCNTPVSECDSCNNLIRPPVLTDCQGNILGDNESSYYRPSFDLRWEFYPWTMSRSYQRDYTPIRLANHSLFNTLVCKEKNQQIYSGNEDEYTIVGTTEKKLRFSFREGYVAMSYLRAAIDDETGYPLIPDNISYIKACVEYVKWQLASWYSWNGRQGFAQEADKAQANWNHYCKQATNYIKMPKTLDDYQDLLEQTHQLVPRHKKYYQFFGKMKRYE